MLVPTLLGILALVFLMIHLVPGDPAQVMLGERASAKALEALRHQLGLDQPLHIQFGEIGGLRCKKARGVDLVGLVRLMWGAMTTGGVFGDFVS